MTPGTSIREARAEDLDAICEIERKAFPGPTAYSRRQMRYLLLKAHGSSRVALHDGAVRGYAIVLHRSGSGTSGLESIAVHPGWRGRGIGAALLASAEGLCRCRGDHVLRVEVSEGNGAAIRMYSEAGYRSVERLVDFYLYEHHGTRHAIRMDKVLS
ncbi:MAG: GNAT family N-acetyltransferase [Thermoplasmata archaeon]|nr:GNAT family N-acetyltransferase [Thermoplasmata archaeon]